jgi:Protein of unknown function (DUF2442)
VLQLTNGETRYTHLGLYPTLMNAGEPDRQNFEIIARGSGLHWPTLDFDLSLEGMLNNIPEHRPDQGGGVIRTP